MSRATSPSARHRPIGMITGNEAMPFSSARIEQHRQDMIWKSHEQKLRTIKSRIDNKQKLTYPHISLNAKRQLFLQEENERIRRENKLLVEKLKAIQQPRPPSRSLEYTGRPGIRLAPGHRPTLDIEKTEDRVHAEPLMSKPRRDELQRIARDNMRISQKLFTATGRYSRQDFHEMAEKQEQYLANIQNNRARVGRGIYPRSTTASLEGGRSRMNSPIASPHNLTGPLQPSRRSRSGGRGSYSRPSSRAGMAPDLPPRPASSLEGAVRYGKSKGRFSTVPDRIMSHASTESLTKMLPEPAQDTDS